MAGEYECEKMSRAPYLRPFPASNSCKLRGELSCMFLITLLLAALVSYNTARHGAFQGFSRRGTMCVSRTHINLTLAATFRVLP